MRLCVCRIAMLIPIEFVNWILQQKTDPTKSKMLIIDAENWIERSKHVVSYFVVLFMRKITKY